MDTNYKQFAIHTNIQNFHGTGNELKSVTTFCDINKSEMGDLKMAINISSDTSQVLNNDSRITKAKNTESRMTTQGHGSKVKVATLNPLITCVLCGGYLIDATVITECLHGFCRSCIVSYLSLSAFCPVCDVRAHARDPLRGIQSDVTLQRLVYKLVPGLFSGELKRQNDYYSRHEYEVSRERMFGHLLRDCCDVIADEELISLSIEFSSMRDSNFNTVGDDCLSISLKRYLLCPAMFPIRLLKKFIRSKFSIPAKYQIHVFHTDESLADEYTISVYHTDEGLADEYTVRDLVYIYSWSKMAPFRLYCTAYETIKPTINQIPSQTSNHTSNHSSKKFPSPHINLKSDSLNLRSSNDVSILEITPSSLSGNSSDDDNSENDDKSDNISISSVRRNLFSKQSALRKCHQSLENATNKRCITSTPRMRPSALFQATPVPHYSQNVLSPIYPIPKYVSPPTESDESDSSDPTFRINQYYTNSPKKKRLKRRRNQNRVHKPPCGLAEVGFYPRHCSTPKGDVNHGSVGSRFDPDYVPVYKRPRCDILNTALLGEHRNGDVYDFDSFSANQNTVTSPVKRKRGRPRKYPIGTSAKSKPNIISPTVTGTKRGRGRPRKYFPAGNKYSAVNKSNVITRGQANSNANNNIGFSHLSTPSPQRPLQSKRTCGMQWIPTSDPIRFIPSIPVSITHKPIKSEHAKRRVAINSDITSLHNIDMTSSSSSSSNETSSSDEDKQMTSLDRDITSDDDDMTSSSESDVTTENDNRDSDTKEPLKSVCDRNDSRNVRNVYMNYVKREHKVIKIDNDAQIKTECTEISTIKPEPTEIVASDNEQKPILPNHKSRHCSTGTARNKLNSKNHFSTNSIVTSQNRLDLDIKQEVEESYPGLRRIIEGRGKGAVPVKPGQRKGAKADVVARFQALNA